LTITHHQPEPQGISQPCVHNLPLDECIVDTTTLAYISRREEDEEEGLTQTTKSQIKAKKVNTTKWKSLVFKNRQKQGSTPLASINNQNEAQN
jgi:hypothetical protein